MRNSIITIAASMLTLGAVPAAAEVTQADDTHFITRSEAVVDATPKEVWLALISPARWWSNEHTWSADAANLTLTPQAGGCFCEKIPEVNEPGRFTLEGSAEHMRVIQAYPEAALRMRGALGPLQSEPVTGILTIALSDDEQGTRIVWEYNVGGQMRYPVDVISTAVDGVMTLQLTRLAEMLGVITGPVQAGGLPPPQEEAGDEPTDEGAPDRSNASESEPDSPLPPSAVDEAFGDLNEPGTP